MIERFFVTGGAGFIGSHLVSKLLSEGHAVTVFDNLSSGKNEFILDFKENNDFKFIKGDLLDLPLLNKSIQGHDMVFHLAANPDIRYGIEYTDTDLKQGTIATYNVLEAMRLNNIKKLGFSSSSVIYGEPKLMPTPENYGPLFPISLYGASKLASEALISSFCHTFNMQGWIYRFANITGSHSTHGIIFDFFKKLQKTPQELEVLGNGKQRKSYLLVEDCVDAMLYVYRNSKNSLNVYNLGCSDQIEISRIAEMFLEEQNLQNKVKIKYTGSERGWAGDVIEMKLDVTQLNNLGWKSPLSSEQVVQKTIHVLMEDYKKKGIL